MYVGDDDFDKAAMHCNLFRRAVIYFFGDNFALLAALNMPLNSIFHKILSCSTALNQWSTIWGFSKGFFSQFLFES